MTASTTELQAMGSYYGAFPTHEGLWRSAAVTSCSLPARLAVEHCVHEARGLDVLPGTIRKLRNGGDEQSAAVLESVIYPEEVSFLSESSVFGDACVWRPRQLPQSALLVTVALKFPVQWGFQSQFCLWRLFKSVN